MLIKYYHSTTRSSPKASGFVSLTLAVRKCIFGSPSDLTDLLHYLLLISETIQVPGVTLSPNRIILQALSPEIYFKPTYRRAYIDWDYKSVCLQNYFSVCWPRYWKDYMVRPSWQYLQLKPLWTSDSAAWRHFPAGSFRHARQSLSSPWWVAHHHQNTSTATSLVGRQGRALIGGQLVLFVWVRGEEVVTVTLQGGLSSQTTSHLPSHCTRLHHTVLLKHFYLQFHILSFYL